MHIALVTNLFPPIQTGTAYWTQELAKYLVEAGHKVVVITYAINGISSQYISNNLTVIRLPAYHMPTNSILLGFDQFYLGNSYTNYRRLRDILVKHNIEIVHQCGHLLDLTYLVPRVCKSLGIPTVCSIHTIIHYPSNKLVDSLMKMIDRVVVKSFAISLYDALIALDHEIATYIRNRYNYQKVGVVFPCIDPKYLKKQVVQNLNDNSLKILSLGHVTSMRNRLNLIKALAKLNQEGVLTELTVVGKICDQSPVKLVQQLGLEKLVTFTGEVPRSQIAKMAPNFHLEAHWITTPGLGTASLEAMSFGLPVMTYGYPGIYGDIPLSDGENIIFVKPDNVNQIATDIARLAASSSLRVSIGQKGQALVRDYLTWPHMIQRLETIYKETVESYLRG